MTTPSGAGRLSQLRDRMRAHPYAMDVLLALLAFTIILFGAATESYTPDGHRHFGARELNAQTTALATLSCGALVWRRRTPMVVLAVTTVVTVLGLVLAPGEGTPADSRVPLVTAAVIALYTVANRTCRTTSWWAGAATVAVLTTAGVLFGATPWYAQENLGIFAWTGMAAAAGEAVRSRRAFVDAIRERAERAERTREEEARRRVTEERMRIARELHDVVAHHIALVNVQAGVAAHVMDQRPDQAKQALAHVREASRHALDELQATVGLLRQTGDGFVRAGLRVDVKAPEPVDPLPSAVDLTAYRVVQEALTNVQKHVGTGAHAMVRIARDHESLEVTVLDNGANGAATPTAAGGGHGLLGMRERVAALHGRCDAGPWEGGFRVNVWLPLRAVQHSARAGLLLPETARRPAHG